MKRFALVVAILFCIAGTAVPGYAQSTPCSNSNCEPFSYKPGANRQMTYSFHNNSLLEIPGNVLQQLGWGAEQWNGWFEEWALDARGFYFSGSLNDPGADITIVFVDDIEGGFTGLNATNVYGDGIIYLDADQVMSRGSDVQFNLGMHEFGHSLGFDNVGDNTGKLSWSQRHAGAADRRACDKHRL